MSLIKVKLIMHRFHHYVKKSMGPKLKINKGLDIQPSTYSFSHSLVYTVHSSVHALIYPFTFHLCQPSIYLYSTGTYFYATNYTIHSGFAWQKASSVALAALPICPEPLITRFSSMYCS